MTLYILRRIAAAIPVLIGVSLIVFISLQLIPGDIARALLGPMASQDTVQRYRESLGLNQPVPIQYLTWLWHVLHGDLGRSFTENIPTTALLAAKLQNTLILVTASLLLAIPLGVLAGIVAATHKFSWSDRLGMGTTLVLGNMPTFVVGLGLIALFAVQIPLFPPLGMYDILGSGGITDLLRHLILPAVTTAIPPAAIIAKMVRGSMLEVLGQDYVRAARANGISMRTVNYRYALRNAMPPIITISGLQVGFLLGGAVFTEYIFAWPGIGLQLQKAILARDISVVQGAVLIIAAWFMLVNLVVDVINRMLDPRLRSPR